MLNLSLSDGWKKRHDFDKGAQVLLFCKQYDTFAARKWCVTPIVRKIKAKITII